MVRACICALCVGGSWEGGSGGGGGEGEVACMLCGEAESWGYIAFWGRVFCLCDFGLIACVSEGKL